MKSTSFKELHKDLDNKSTSPYNYKALRIDSSQRRNVSSINQQDEHFENFKLDNLDSENFASKSVMKSTSKPYVKAAKTSNRDLSSSKVELKSPVNNPRKDPSKTKLNSASKINLYSSVSPGKSPSKNRNSKSPVRTNTISTTNFQKITTDNKNTTKKPVMRNVSIINSNNKSGCLESILNFEMIKNFTNLNYKDISIGEMIYSAEISNVFRGKYLHLPVAIKVYDIAKLKEEDLVK